jgi:small subunit ribosomal protein S21
MSVEIKIRKGETVDKALRRLKKKIDREGIIKDARAKRGFEKRGRTPPPQEEGQELQRLPA